VVVLYFPLIGLPVMSIFCLFQWVMPHSYEWLILLGIGLTTQIAQVNMTKALQQGELTVITLMKYFGVVFAFLYGYFLFGETYSWLSVVGILLVITGVVLNILYKNYRNNPSTAG
jgi:drug/metabolite transporter (DMT)-like permease